MQKSLARSDPCEVVVDVHPPTTDAIRPPPFSIEPRFSANFSVSCELMVESSFCFRIFVNQSMFSLSLRFGDCNCKCGASPLTTKLGRFEVGDANNEEALRFTYGDRNEEPA